MLGRFSLRDDLYLVLPEWAVDLKMYYWHIRVYGRVSATRRRYYRKVAKEKLRLAELGVRQDVIKMVCQYLHGLKASKGLRLAVMLSSEPIQTTFNFDS